jgi:hypothetical protein
MSRTTRNPARHLIFSVSRSKGTWLVALFAALWLGSATIANATPIEPTVKELLKQVERPATTFIPARVGWNTPEKQPAYFNLALEQYGPQATVRAVRASLKAALTPDPVAMAALLFCAFALRWMRLRKEQVQENAEVAVVEVPLAKIA